MTAGPKPVSIARAQTRSAVLFSPDADAPRRLGLSHSGGVIAVASDMNGARAYLYKGPAAKHRAIGVLPKGA